LFFLLQKTYVSCRVGDGCRFRGGVDNAAVFLRNVGWGTKGRHMSPTSTETVWVVFAEFPPRLRGDNCRREKRQQTGGVNGNYW